MGVLACNRTGCENIMCNRYSSMHGYICNECFSEFTESTVYAQDFMTSTKEPDIKEKNREDYCNHVFPCT